jgi:hypothetical protein
MSLTFKNDAFLIARRVTMGHYFKNYWHASKWSSISSSHWKSPSFGNFSFPRFVGLLILSLWFQHTHWQNWLNCHKRKHIFFVTHSTWHATAAILGVVKLNDRVGPNDAKLSIKLPQQMLQCTVFNEIARTMYETWRHAPDRVSGKIVNFRFIIIISLNVPTAGAQAFQWQCMRHDVTHLMEWAGKLWISDSSSSSSAY